MSEGVKVRQLQGVSVLELQSALKGPVSSGLRETIQQEIRSGRVRLVLDLSRVDTVDGLALSSLVGSYLELKQHQGRLILCNPTPRFTLALEQTGLSKFLPVAPDLPRAEAEALR